MNVWLVNKHQPRGKFANSSILDSSTVESNLRIVNQFYLSTVARDSFHLDSLQIEALTDIASQCPLYGGYGVFGARALLSLLTDTVFLDDDLCSGGGVRINKKNPHRSQGAQLNSNCLMYPNPTNSKITLKYYGDVEEDMQVFVTDLLGAQSLLIGDLKSNSMDIDVSTLASGMYFITLMKNGSQIFRAKFNVIK